MSNNDVLAKLIRSGTLRKLIRSGSLRELLAHVLEHEAEKPQPARAGAHERAVLVEQLALALDEALEHRCEEASEDVDTLVRHYDDRASHETRATAITERLHAIFIEGFARAKPEREHPRHPKFPIGPLSEEDSPALFIAGYKGENYCPECAEEAFGPDWPSGESDNCDGSHPGDCCWETYTTGWMGPIVCSACKMSIPVYVDGEEGART